MHVGGHVGGAVARGHGEGAVVGLGDPVQLRVGSGVGVRVGGDPLQALEEVKRRHGEQ